MNGDAPTEAQPLIAGRYRQIRRIGTGGMSVVVLAEDTVLKRTVALKLIAEHLAGDADFVTRFRHEALAVARLQHPSIVQVFDSGHDQESGRQFIVMEYIEGTPLSEMLSGGRQLEPARAVAIASDACEALECAHRAGVIHRDVKPANLIVTPDGGAKLMDFGIAKAAEMTRVTQVGSVLGTVAYLSPEQAIGGETGPRSDIYSLAVVTYEMLAGRLPYEYKSITELAMKQRDETPQPISPLNALVPVELDRTVRVALNHDPERRFADAREFGEALRQGLKRHETDFVTAILSDPDAATRLIAARDVAAGSRSPKGRRAARAATAATAVAAANALGAVGASRTTESTRVAAAAAPIPAAPAPATRVSSAATPAAASPVGDTPQRGHRRLKRFFAISLLLLAIGAAAAGGFLLGDSGTAPVVKQTLQDQIDAMRGFIQEHR
ncbi:MAG: serine/threonine protein kinase [Actinobacteria bacterium]|nr:serine/threonine protein kinase [Actinomycetota bacterium]